MNSLKINLKKLKTYSLDENDMWGSLCKIIEFLLPVFFGYLKQVHHGEIYRIDMVTGKMFIVDFRDGQKMVFLTVFFAF